MYSYMNMVRKERSRVLYDAMVAGIGITTLGVVIWAILSPDPPREGHIIRKDFSPAHWMPAGKTMVRVSDSWNLIISNSDASQPTKARYGYYSVEQSVYDAHQVGDYIRFAQVSPIWDYLGRIVLLVIGAVVVVVAGGIGSVVLDDLAIGWSWAGLSVGTLAMLVVLLIGEGMVYMGVAGPDGRL